MTKIQNKFMSVAKSLFKVGLAFIILAIGGATLIASGAAFFGAI